MQHPRIQAKKQILCAEEFGGKDASSLVNSYQQNVFNAVEKMCCERNFASSNLLLKMVITYHIASSGIARAAHRKPNQLGAWSLF